VSGPRPCCDCSWLAHVLNFAFRHLSVTRTQVVVTVRGVMVEPPINWAGLPRSPHTYSMYKQYVQTDIHFVKQVGLAHTFLINTLLSMSSSIINHSLYVCCTSGELKEVVCKGWLMGGGCRPGQMFNLCL